MRVGFARDFDLAKNLQGGRVSLPEIVSSADLAALLGISQGELRNHFRRGLVVRVSTGKYDLQASVRTCFAHLRDVASGRGGQDAALTLSAERARLAKEQADGAALKNASLRGGLLDAGEVERTWSDACRRLRAAMLSISSRVRHQLPHLSRNDADVLDGEIRLALKELAGDAV